MAPGSGISRNFSQEHDGSRHRDNGGWNGWWPIFFGLAFFANALGFVPPQLFWPVLLTAFGVAIAWKVVVPVSRRVGQGEAVTGRTLSEAAGPERGQASRVPDARGG